MSGRSQALTRLIGLCKPSCTISLSSSLDLVGFDNSSEGGKYPRSSPLKVAFRPASTTASTPRAQVSLRAQTVCLGRSRICQPVSAPGRDGSKPLRLSLQNGADG